MNPFASFASFATFAPARTLVLAAAAAAAFTAQAAPTELMPGFASAPTGWSTDRYDAASFGNVGSYQGRNNVLGIGIDSSTDLANRGAAFQSSFYNTQGRKQAISGGSGSILSADLYINADWAAASNGYKRTDMWGTMTDSAGVTAYTIIGFTNYGTAGARLRVWDADVSGGWVDLANTIAYDAWTSLAIEFDGNSFDYFVGGTLVYSDTTIGTTTGFGEVIMQAYNFADPSLGSPATSAYVAHWANVGAAVPEPGTLALAALALLGAATVRRRA
jgi:PEP-CTERM motif